MGTSLRSSLFFFRLFFAGGAVDGSRSASSSSWEGRPGRGGGGGGRGCCTGQLGSVLSICGWGAAASVMPVSCSDSKVPRWTPSDGRLISASWSCPLMLLPLDPEAIHGLPGSMGGRLGGTQQSMGGSCLDRFA